MEKPVLLVGATGFIGKHLFDRLLKAGRSVVVLTRENNGTNAHVRVRRALRQARGGRDSHVGPFRVLVGDMRKRRLGMNGRDYRRLAQTIGSVVNVAGRTHFAARPDGEPHATNVGGLGELIDLAAAAGAPIHHFSTAFVCGDHRGTWRETDNRPARHRNAYEESKWRGERMLSEAVAEGRVSGVTVYRPSIVIPDRAGMEVSRDAGLNTLVRALSLAAKKSPNLPGDDRRRDLRFLRIAANPKAPVHAAPVGWVADVFQHIFSEPRLHGRTYHLALSNPPLVHGLRSALENRLGVRLGPYVGVKDGCRPGPDMDEEEAFYRMLGPVGDYFRQEMRFATDNLDEALANSGLEQPVFDASLWDYMIESALRRTNGEKRAGAPGAGEKGAITDFFEKWLPLHAPLSPLSKMRSLTVDAGFWIENTGNWTCRFHEGELTSVERGADLADVPFGYRVDRATFADVVACRMTPQEGFLSERIEILGDMERALKFAMILQQFFQEFPWREGGACHGDG